MDILRGVAGIGFCLGVAILVHEFGHFILAKLFRIEVLRFSIGFGRFIFKWRRKETEYGVAWFPLGGYVLMKGAVDPELRQYTEGEESPPPAAGPPQEPAAQEAPAIKGVKGMIEAGVSDSTSLYQRPFYQKLAIYAGGVTMNWITAVITIGFVYWIGFEVSKSPAPVIAQFDWPSGYEAPALLPGDRILTANGKVVEEWDDFLEVMATAYKETPEDLVTLEIQREGAPGPIQVTLPARMPDGENSPARYMHAHHPAFIEDVFPNKAADKAGLRAGDLITAIDGKPVNSWMEMAAIIRANPERELELQALRGDKYLTIRITPESNPKEPGVGQIGIFQGNQERELRREPFLEAFGRAPLRTWQTSVFYVQQIGVIFQNLAQMRFRAVGDDVGGPIVIAQQAYRSAQKGLADYLMFFFAINIALAIFNLLPIPMLDGGHIVFAAYERIFGRPVSPRIHVALLYAGLAVIVALAVVISINDLFKIVR